MISQKDQDHFYNRMHVNHSVLLKADINLNDADHKDELAKCTSYNKEINTVQLVKEKLIKDRKAWRQAHKRVSIHLCPFVSSEIKIPGKHVPNREFYKDDVIRRSLRNCKKLHIYHTENQTFYRFLHKKFQKLLSDDIRILTKEIMDDLFKCIGIVDSINTPELVLCKIISDQEHWKQSNSNLKLGFCPFNYFPSRLVQKNVIKKRINNNELDESNSGKVKRAKQK